MATSLDLSKAFDIIDHNIFNDKLCNEIIRQVDHTQILGLHIDNSLKQTY